MNQVQRYSDAEIISGIKKGEDLVLNLLFAEFKPAVMAYLQKKGCSGIDGEDIFMDALQAVYLKVRDDQLVLKNCSFKTYLMSISIKLWWNKCRRKKFDAGVTPDDLVSLRDEYDLEVELAKVERMQLFKECFQKLGDGCKTLLQLFLVDQVPLKDVADQLGMSYEYSRKKSSNCQKQLGQLVKLDPRFKELSS